MIYEFICNNEDCGHKESYMVPVAERERVANEPCPKCGEKTHPAPWRGGLIVKGSRPQKIRNLGSFSHKGEEIKFGVLDHRGKNDLAKDSIGQRIKGARMDEKSGRMVIDVVSNVPDPLGKLAEARKETAKVKVGQKVKRRQK